MVHNTHDMVIFGLFRFWLPESRTDKSDFNSFTKIWYNTCFLMYIIYSIYQESYLKDYKEWTIYIVIYSNMVILDGCDIPVHVNF